MVLLPEGEDPDSYAQTHDSSEFIRYIEEHQTDFIQFKLALLSKEAGNDLQKRTMLVKDIATSISVIPDIITRRDYIRNCAMQLHVDEQSLTKGTDTLRKKRIEENKKRREEEERHKEENNTNVSIEGEENNQDNALDDIQFLDQVSSNALEQNFYNLFQLVVKYGERPIEVEEEKFTIGEIIVYTIEGDQIQPPRPVYQTMMDEFKAHYKEPGFKAEQFFKFHPDPAVSALAIDMIADKYTLAEMENESQLGELVTRLLYEIKLTVINIQLDELENRLKDAQSIGDINSQLQLLSYQPALIRQRNEICKLLGNRVINI